VDLDLRLLKDMHPLLPASEAATYTYRSSLALQRRGHAPGVETTVTVDGDPEVQASLHWDEADQEGQAQVDRIGVTEFGAEAVSLVLVSVARKWTVEKRLQRFQSADWLLVTPDGERVALEISGIDGDFDRRRLAEKLGQVRSVKFCALRFASVVAFARPQAVLAGA